MHHLPQSRPFNTPSLSPSLLKEVPRQIQRTRERRKIQQVESQDKERISQHRRPLPLSRTPTQQHQHSFFFINFQFLLQAEVAPLDQIFPTINLRFKFKFKIIQIYGLSTIILFQTFAYSYLLSIDNIIVLLLDYDFSLWKPVCLNILLNSKTLIEMSFS